MYMKVCLHTALVRVRHDVTHSYPLFITETCQTSINEISWIMSSSGTVCFNLYTYRQSTSLSKYWRQPSHSRFSARRLHHFPFVIRKSAAPQLQMRKKNKKKTNNEVLVRGRPSDRGLLILLQPFMSSASVIARGVHKGAALFS